ncbi:hypothetical protein E1A91_D01G002100v1 [Gossypium mustelinum]|uniref:Uncharacterized protein n=1 Tax=Gossypium mustelinum TaxID=34275 RepID=A0A5D2W1X9_GOSMU|nr:hypothetical protein E1A91_D01G002100v1 [Gossypium mustelinum]
MVKSLRASGIPFKAVLSKAASITQIMQMAACNMKNPSFHRNETPKQKRKKERSINYVHLCIK